VGYVTAGPGRRDAGDKDVRGLRDGGATATGRERGDGG